jgi:hypothetical protein
LVLGLGKILAEELCNSLVIDKWTEFRWAKRMRSNVSVLVNSGSEEKA